MFKNPKVFFCIFYFILSVLVYTQSLSFHGFEYRDDEVFYYNSAKEMVQSGDYLSPTYFGEDRFQKPILFYWFVVICYKIFGINWFAARLASVVFAGLTVVATWLIARRLFESKHIAHLSALILMTSPLFFRHAKNVVPDMALTFFIVLACYLMLNIKESLKSDKVLPGINSLNYVFFAVIACGFMVKGIAALLVPVLFLLCYFCFTGDSRSIKKVLWGRGFLIFLAICLPWFLYMIARHGFGYMDYMVSHETQNRILGVEQHGGFLLARVHQFFKNAIYYTQILFQYFSPWSLFLIFVIPIAVSRIAKNHKDRSSLIFILTWMGIVFLMFSFMDFKISHYMLPLSSAYAILLSYFLCGMFSERLLQGKLLNSIREFYILLMIGLCVFVYCFLLVFIYKFNPWVIVLVVSACVYVFCLIRIKKNIVLPSYILAGFLIFILVQAQVFAKIGITSHSVLQKIAEEVNELKDEDYVMGIGSHDIHEKEFQIYFDRKVEKLVNNDPKHNIYYINILFNKSQDVFCLLTEKDYNHYFSEHPLKDVHVEVIDERFLVRKRFYIDKGFFTALLKMDQDKVYGYIMEKIVLIRKVNNA